jgi:O-succinylbenzoic acid--CoA ligase
VIDLDSRSTELLLNPRLPAREKHRLESIFGNVPRLEGHVWVTTSGSSGALKLVALSKDALRASAAAVNAHLRATPDDVWCSPLPDFHVGGIGILARARLTSSRVIPLEPWSAERFVSLSMEQGVTLSALVPAQVSDLVAAGLAAPKSVRAIVVGGGALPEPLYDAARSLGWPLLPSYGMTEACSQIATAPLTSLDEGRFPDLEILSHVEVRVADGKIAVRGDSLLTGYGVEEDGIARFVDPKRDGWFVSEDAGEVFEKEGRAFVRPFGRSADFIKIGGESSSVARLQEIAERVARAVGTDAAVIAVPDQRLGMVVHIVVSDPRVGAEVRRVYDESVLPFERARALHVLPIPRSPLGKLQRESLRRLIEG